MHENSSWNLVDINTFEPEKIIPMIQPKKIKTIAYNEVNPGDHKKLKGSRLKYLKSCCECIRLGAKCTPGLTTKSCSHCWENNIPCLIPEAKQGVDKKSLTYTCKIDDICSSKRRRVSNET